MDRHQSTLGKNGQNEVHVIGLDTRGYNNIVDKIEIFTRPQRAAAITSRSWETLNKLDL